MKNENLVENWMGSYITQERADHGPITNPSGTHIRANISPVFLKITSPEEGKQKCKYDLVRNRKTQLISTIEAPIHLDQRPSNAILVRPRLLIMTTKIFGLTKKKERYYAEISGISYITLWAIFFCKPCVELPTNQFLSKPSLMWRNFKKLSTLHGSPAPMVYSHEKQL